MAEDSSCEGTCRISYNCSGTIVATSGEIIKDSKSLDYSLIKLPSNPSKDYGYLQLRSTLPTVQEKIYIVHHPRGLGKKFLKSKKNSLARFSNSIFDHVLVVKAIFHMSVILNVEVRVLQLFQ